MAEPTVKAHLNKDDDTLLELKVPTRAQQLSQNTESSGTKWSSISEFSHFRISEDVETDSPKDVREYCAVYRC